MTDTLIRVKTSGEAEWKKETYYSANEIAINKETAFLCKTPHTSTGLFEAEKWIELGANVVAEGGVTESKLAAAVKTKINVGAFKAVTEKNANLEVNGNIEAREEHGTVGRLRNLGTGLIGGIPSGTKLFNLPAGTFPKEELSIIQRGSFKLILKTNGEVMLGGGELKNLEVLFFDGITWPL